MSEDEFDDPVQLPPIEAGSPDAENVAFFVLGVVVAVAVLAQLVL